jgi:hypothetical protein
MGVDCIQLCRILCSLSGNYEYMKITIFRNVTHCSSVDGCQRYILKTEAVRGFVTLECYRMPRCHIPKQFSKNFLINWVTISFSRKAPITYFVAGRAPRLQGLGMMPSTVQLSFSIEVDEIHKQLLTDATREARRMPASVGPGSRRENADIATRQSLLALQHTASR